MLARKVALQAFGGGEEHWALVTAEPNFGDDVSVEFVSVRHNETNYIRAEFALELSTAKFRSCLSCRRKCLWIIHFAIWVHHPKVLNFFKVIPVK